MTESKRRNSVLQNCIIFDNLPKLISMNRISLGLILIYLIINTTLHAQELYIVSHAAANISKDRIELRNIAKSYDDLNAFHYDFQVNYGLLGNLTLYNGVTYTLNSTNQFICLLYTSPSPRDGLLSRMPSSA